MHIGDRTNTQSQTSLHDQAQQGRCCIALHNRTSETPSITLCSHVAGEPWFAPPGPPRARGPCTDGPRSLKYILMRLNMPHAAPAAALWSARGITPFPSLERMACSFRRVVHTHLPIDPPPPRYSPSPSISLPSLRPAPLTMPRRHTQSSTTGSPAPRTRLMTSAASFSPTADVTMAVTARSMCLLSSSACSSEERADCCARELAGEREYCEGEGREGGGEGGKGAGWDSQASATGRQASFRCSSLALQRHSHLPVGKWNCCPQTAHSL